MPTETFPHQIDQMTPVSAFLGTGNEAPGGEVSAALQDWIQRAMDALAAVGPPPVGVVPNSVPTQRLPALGEVMLEVEPSNIDTNNPLANPRHRREIIRAAFDYALGPPQTTSHSSEDRLDCRADTPTEVPGNLLVDRSACTADVDAPAGPVAADFPHPEPFPSPHNVSPHSSPTPTAGVIPTPPMLPSSDAVVDLAMADRSQNAIGDEGQQAIQATMTSISNDHHRDGQGEHNGDADKANAIEVRTTDALQQDASISISQYEIEYARAERERQEMKRRIAEDRQRAWAKDATTSRRDATTARKGATTPRNDARAEEHKSRAPKTRRQASPLPALLNRLRDPRPYACIYNSERDDPQLPSTPTLSPRDRSPTPSTPPPSEYAGLPLAQRLLPVPLVSRIGPHPDTPPSVASFAQANDEEHSGPLIGRRGSRIGQSNSAASSQRANDETRGRRPARASRSIEPSSTLSRNGALPRVLPTRKAGKAPAAAASAQITMTGTRKAGGAGNSEQRLESASQRPATLASSAPGSTSVKTAEGVTGIPKLVVDEGRASGKAGPSDAMAVDDPAEPTTQSIVPRMATTTVSPQIVTPPPTPSTPSSNIDNRVSSNSPGPLPPPAENASSSTGVQVSPASSHHDSEAGDSGIQPQTSPKRSYEEIATELLSSTIPLDRSHSTRAQELAPAQTQSTVTPASPGGRAAPAIPTSTPPNISPVPESTGINAAYSSHAPTLTNSATSSVISDCSASPRVDSSELGEYIFSLPVDNSVPMGASIEHTMEVERGDDPDQPVNTGEQSYGPLKMEEDMDEPMKVDEDTDEPIQVEEEEYTASTKGEEEELAMKTENEVTFKTEEVKDVLVPVEPAPRYEPRALVPKLRQHSAAFPSIRPSHSSLGPTTNSNEQSLWIEMPPRTLPQESYLPMSRDGRQPSMAQDEPQPVVLSPEQGPRRSPRTTRSVYRRPSAAHSDSPRASASAPAWTPSASAQSASCTQSSPAAVVQPSLAVAQSPFVAGQSSPASTQSSSVPARVSSAAAGPSSGPMDLPATSAPISDTSLGRFYRIPAPSDDEEEGMRVTPILKLRRMNDDHPLERPSKWARWA
ncbi:hypothetical protein K525DRAFT_285018 [Schizophyllum commune Loenen D]|nr:hypothetical protein K525DRAFT_285018 [Schizophyllum commune Loenen D]